jgi:repressor LexA
VTSEALTDRQREVLDFLRDYIAANGRPPTLREVGVGVGMCFSRVGHHMRALERKGAIRYAGGARSAVPVQTP